MLVLSAIHIYNVLAAIYKVLQTFSQRITCVIVLFNTGVCKKRYVILLKVNNIGQNKGEEIIHCLTDCDTTNVPMC